MGRRAGDDFNQAFVLQLSESAQHTAAVALEELAGCSKKLLVHHSQGLKRQVVPGAPDFLIRQFHPALEIAPVAGLQQRIVQHFRQRRRDGDGKAAGHFVLRQSDENGNQRKVTLSDGFEEPVFLQKSWVLGMADKGKVGMQDDGKKALRHLSGHCKRQDGAATIENRKTLAALLNLWDTFYFGFRASIASGGTVTWSEYGRPCQGKSSEGRPPAFPIFWPP